MSERGLKINTRTQWSQHFMGDRRLAHPLLVLKCVHFGFEFPTKKGGNNARNNNHYPIGVVAAWNDLGTKPGRNDLASTGCGSGFICRKNGHRA